MKKGKKPQISKVKRNNQKRTKLARQGKLKLRRNRAPRPKHVQPVPPKPKPRDEEEEEEESDHGEDLLQMVEPDDLEFLKNAVTNKSYSILKEIHYNDRKEKAKGQKRKHTDDDNIEESYEKAASDSGTKRTKYLLPIKTSSGLVLRSTEEEEEENEGNDDQPPIEETSTKQKQEEEDSDYEIITEPLKDFENLDPSKPLSTADLLACREELLEKRKFQIGVLCSGLLENPEIKVKNFKTLLSMLEEKSELLISVRKLAAVSLLEIFKDLLPSYQIKHHETPGVKLKKDTLKLQGYEKSLLKYYKTYLQIMEKLASALRKKKGDKTISTSQDRMLGEVAVKCLCSLLVMHPYFNFSINLVQLLVPFLNHSIPTLRQEVASCFQTVLKEDKKGEISLKIVQRINAFVKKLSHAVHCEVLTVLLAVKIKDVNLDQEKEAEIKQKKFMTHKQKLLRMSKRERKRSKKLEQLEKELLETKAEENKQTKQQFLTEITKVVFTIYFRILKTAPSSKLLSVTLEGVAKFAHCINVEFYHDLVNVLDQIVEGDNIGCREQLHCVQTVFKILSGQGEALNIDPSRFYTHLYRNLLTIHAGRNYVDLPILLHTLDLALVQCRRRVSRQRLFAFVKRLSTLSLQLLHNGSLSCLALIKKIVQANKYLDALMDTDNTFGGVYFPELEEPEYCNANSSTIWELIALRRHYHPTVRKYSEHLLLNCPTSGEGSLAPDIAKLSAENLYHDFNPLAMMFNPPVPPPRKMQHNSGPSRNLNS